MCRRMPGPYLSMARRYLTTDWLVSAGMGSPAFGEPGVMKSSLIMSTPLVEDQCSALYSIC